ncbi:hypothetical protein GF319_04270 [Candidatus Bathyarchaeota archaeon]|nr:hypothetical protein [Candidatus Bathyarchaeota archaeon]
MIIRLDLNPVDTVRIFNLLRGKIPQTQDEEEIFQRYIRLLWIIKESDLFGYKIEQDSKCKRCGGCCIKSGLIILTRDEFSDIAKYLEISLEVLLMKVKARIEGDSIKISGIPCPFFIKSSKLCRIYPVRPEVCREFPIGHMIVKVRKHSIPFIGFCSASDEILVDIILQKINKIGLLQENLSNNSEIMNIS